MNKLEILQTVDHTLLKPEATWTEVEKLCHEALSYDAASVCISPCYVQQATQFLDGRLPVCTVIGFPSGATMGKVQEAQDAIDHGALEIDMVIHIGAVKMSQWTALQQEIEAVKAACGTRVLKVIVEACLLTEDEKIKICEIVSISGADYIKTSTGFSTGGATFADVALFRRHVSPHVKIKAAGGVRTWETAAEFLRLGAQRLGSSALIPMAMAEGCTAPSAGDNY